MNKNNIVLEVLCDYENEAELIYKFITEEFFAQEIDDVRIDGMSQIYCYEEFHPNHEYDLKRHSQEFMESLFEREFHREFDKYCLFDIVKYQNDELDRLAFIDKISSFQEINKPGKIINRKILRAEFDLDKGFAEVNGEITYSANCRTHSGEFKLLFCMDELGYWCINGVDIPDF
jgi:hypothetical protein